MAIITNPGITVSLAYEPVPKPKPADYTYQDINEVPIQFREAMRQQLQKFIDNEFTDEDQAVLWKCLNDKVEDWVHRGLDRIIRRRITMDCPEVLYRGVNKRMLTVLQDTDVGDEFTTSGVTSFTADFHTSRNFANHSMYGTKTIIKWDKPTMAYNYQEDMLRILTAAPDCEFSSSPYDKNAIVDRRNKVGMVQDEQEWMMPVGTTFRVLRIEDVEYDKGIQYVIYHVELLSI